MIYANAYMKKERQSALFLQLRQFFYIIYCSNGCDCLYSWSKELNYQARTEV